VLNWPSSTSDFSGHPLVGDAVIDGQRNLYAGEESPNQIAKVLIGTTTELTKATDSVSGAPILGAGGITYTVANSGAISAWKTADLTPLWTASLGTGIQVLASPNLDCSRNADGSARAGAPGVLYMASETGKIYALLVDSPGVDATAPWPMYLHDPRHTANSTTDLTPFSCP
jgi:hypothetical protein